MNGRDLLRSWKSAAQAGPLPGLHALRYAWRRRQADAAALPAGEGERARVPGEVQECTPAPGGGTVRFERASLTVTVSVQGSVFWGWDGAGPLPGHALAGEPPAADVRAVFEPDKEGGWRVVSQRATVTVSRHGALEVRTPGGVLLRRELPPRWWDSEGGGHSRWVLRSEVPADARFFGGVTDGGGPLLRDGTYRLWHGSRLPRRGQGPQHGLVMPVQMVVTDAGSHLVFCDNPWDGRLTVREGHEGAGSGHDRPGSSVLRMSGGPLRGWVLVGPPARILANWAALTGPALVPPPWAFGHQVRCAGEPDEERIRRAVTGWTEAGLPPAAVHMDVGRGAFSVSSDRLPKPAALAAELAATGTRLVAAVGGAVAAVPGEPAYVRGTESGAFVRDARGRTVEGVTPHGPCVYPDFTDPATRAWWGGRYEEALAEGFAGFVHHGDTAVSMATFGERTLPMSARNGHDGEGGDHRSAHNVRGLLMARAAQEGLRRIVPGEQHLLTAGAGWAGVQRYAALWPATGSARAPGWEGLRQALADVLGLGLCGVPFTGCELGGPEAAEDGELFARSLQLGAYLPLLRTTAVPGSGSVPDGAVHAALAERQRLEPYVRTLAAQAHLTGAPLVRPLWWGAAGDRVARDCEDAFLLGDALLVAPVLEPGVTHREVPLPPGLWYDVVSGAPLRGPGRVRLAAPAHRIPVLARAGAVFPVRGEDGAVHLEVWAPPEGAAGVGTLVAEDPLESRQFTVRRQGSRVTVTGEGGAEVGLPVRVRGL